MRKFIVFAILMLVSVAAVAFGADVVAVASAPVPAAANTFNDVMVWIVGHQVVLGMLIVAILDFIFSINPEWKSNSILHMLYLFAQGRKETTPTV